MAMGQGISRRNGKWSAAPHKPSLAGRESAVSRDKLLCELAVLSSPDDLASWAHRILPIKNTLTAVDARLLEEAFAENMTTVAEPLADVAASVTIAAAPVSSDIPAAQTVSNSDVGKKRRGRGLKSVRRQNPAHSAIDKSVLAFPEPRRLRDKEHLSSLLGSLASSANDSPLMLTTFVLRNSEPSVAKSATNSRFRFAERITVKFIAMVMKQHGGANFV